MSHVVGGSRQMLRRLRDMMAGSGSAQSRLDEIVRIIAAELVAEVCSIYVCRPDSRLELYATQGLNREAVHKTTLRVGEGLVGDIAANARPLAVADAQSHPRFAYRPETGEEIYHSLLGVPVLRSNRVLGVLVVQNRTRRHYAEEEVESLETIAMVLAEMLSQPELLPAGPSGGGMRPVRLGGAKVCEGLAIGRVWLHRNRVVIRQVVAEDVEGELARLGGAVEGMQADLDALIAVADIAPAGEHRDVLEAFRMFAEDAGWLNRIREAVRSGLTAEAGVQKVQNDTRTRMKQISDPYLRERLHDFEDLTSRLLQRLVPSEEGTRELPEATVIVARSMGPAELLDYDRRRLRGLVLEEGSAAAHVAIVARALDLPVVGRCRGILGEVEPDDVIVVDGDNGQVFLRPGDDARASFERALAAREQRRAEYSALRDRPAATRDGVAVELQINAGLLVDLAHLEETGATGVGLYRTEIPFMVRHEYPGVAAQTDLYRRILDHAGGRPVVFRTLDAGGDKRLPYFAYEEDENPAMGWRALRIGLDRPALLRQQLRAMIRASESRDLSVMFPMVAEVSEFRAARRLLDRELVRAASHGWLAPSSVSVGAMLEVPALLWQLPALLKEVDFLSIGSNDLQQFLFAADRGSPRAAERYDPLSPAMLRILARIAEESAAAGVPVTVCGEMAGRPLEAMALIGLGLTRLSMPPAAIGPVKSMTCTLNCRELRGYLADLLHSSERSVRKSLHFFAVDHGVSL